MARWRCMRSCCIGGCCSHGEVEAPHHSCPSKNLYRDYLCISMIASMRKLGALLLSLPVGAATRKHAKVRHAKSKLFMPMDAASYMAVCLQGQRPQKERLPVVATVSEVEGPNCTDKKLRQTCRKTQAHEAPSITCQNLTLRQQQS